MWENECAFRCCFACCYKVQSNSKHWLKINPHWIVVLLSAHVKCGFSLKISRCFGIRAYKFSPSLFLSSLLLSFLCSHQHYTNIYIYRILCSAAFISRQFFKCVTLAWVANIEHTASLRDELTAANKTMCHEAATQPYESKWSSHLHLPEIHCLLLSSFRSVFRILVCHANVQEGGNDTLNNNLNTVTNCCHFCQSKLNAFAFNQNKL